jgi:hypothetical protein
MLLLQLSQPAGDLGEVASLEEAEDEADAAIAPAAHDDEAAKKEGQAAPGGGDQAVFKALVGFQLAELVGLLLGVTAERRSRPTGENDAFI